MTNDILEQFAEDFFREKGFFTQHNVPYKPHGIDVHSDIDLLAIHPLTHEVAVVSCKSYEVDVRKMLETLESDNPNKIIKGGSFTKRFREIADKNSSSTLKEKIFDLTGKHKFTFYLAVTNFKGDKNKFEKFPLFKENLSNCEIKLITLKDIVLFLEENKTTTPSHNELVRTLQLLKISGGVINFK